MYARNLEKEQEALSWIRDEGNFHHLSEALQEAGQIALRHCHTSDPWKAARDHLNQSGRYKPCSRGSLINRVLNVKRIITNQKFCERCGALLPDKRHKRLNPKYCRPCHEIICPSKPINNEDGPYLVVTLEGRALPGFLVARVLYRHQMRGSPRISFEEDSKSRLYIAAASVASVLPDKKDGCWVHLRPEGRYHFRESQPVVSMALARCS